MTQPRFKLSKSSDGQFTFNLSGANGEIVLASERYTTRANAENGIASVRANAPNDDRYDRRTAKNDQPYFVLIAPNGQVIGTSEMYSSKAAMETGIAAVKKNAPIAAVE